MMGALEVLMGGQPADMPDEETAEVLSLLFPSVRAPYLTLLDRQQSVEARQIILGAVGKLHAYLPSPDTDMAYFKRMLKVHSKLWIFGSVVTERLLH